MAQKALYNDATTPMLRQYMAIKKEHPDSILMFRLGDFYEMFFDDAVLASSILDITLTSRNKNDPKPIPLCGVPYHSVEPYIARLLENGKKVAICDQVEDPKLAKGVVKREVTRVLTPGVIPDGLGLEAKSHNFLASVSRDGERYGLAVTDVSTGLFQAGEFEGFRELCEELSRFEPREMLLAGEIATDANFSSEISRLFPAAAVSAATDCGLNLSSISLLEGGTPFVQDRRAAAKAAAAALSYISFTQKGRVSHIGSIRPISGGAAMRLDDSTKRNLELVKTMREGNRQGSLLWAIDRTLTAPGARKLKRWILSPLIDPEKINSRLDAVEGFVSNPGLMRQTADELRKIHDIERITSRAAMELANPRDMAGLLESLSAVGKLKDLLSEQPGRLAAEAAALDPHGPLADMISTRLVENPPIALREGGIIREGFSTELDSLRDIVAHGKDFIAGLEAKERAATGIGSLKIRFNRVFGYYLEVTNTHRDKVPSTYIRKQTLANAERYITPELKEYEEKILGAEEKARRLEQELFEELRSKTGALSGSLFSTADAASTIDALLSLAQVAAEHDYRRPEVAASPELDIRDGRHPIVERQESASRFVPNDVSVGGEAPRFLMITGPNMAGKSTVMRQTALIALMAQVGSFVPASSAKIGVFDRIFTRVGASDALLQGQSTFMVEMAEAAVILGEATEKSLVIIDEIGRGTSTYDGLAIAWAVAEDLHDRVKARTLFATHYHELTDLAITKPGIKNMQIAVKEWNGEVIFLRRLVPGAISRSYGIQVARLAGLPGKVIERASEVLQNLESGELDDVGMPRIAGAGAGFATPNQAQFQLFNKPIPHDVEKKLAETDLDSITPIDALNLLHQLKGLV